VTHEEPRTPRERRHDESARRILDEAMRMVEQGGLEALSMNRLAEAVHYTPGALYRYFASKDALLAQLVVRILEDVRLALAAALAALPPRATPLARVLALALGYRSFARREPQRFGLLAMTMAEPRVLIDQPEAAPVVTLMLAVMQPLGAALTAAAEARLLAPGDPAERTILVFALLQGVLPLHKQTRYAPRLLDIDHLLSRGLRALLMGWGASARAVDTATRQLASIGDAAEPPRTGATS